MQTRSLANGTLWLDCLSSPSRGRRCLPGFVPVGDGRLRCSFGQLIKQGVQAFLACRRSNCTVTAPPNGTLGNCPPDGNLPTESSCDLDCQPGYMRVATTNRTVACLVNATLAAPNPLVCEPRGCPLPPLPIGGMRAGWACYVVCFLPIRRFMVAVVAPLRLAPILVGQVLVTNGCPCLSIGVAGLPCTRHDNSPSFAPVQRWPGLAVHARYCPAGSRAYLNANQGFGRATARAMRHAYWAI
jgi:hypothetical protein